MFSVEDHAGDKRCSSCGDVKPRADYYRSARARDGRQARCKVCHSAAVRASRARHAEANDRRGRPAVDEKRCSGCGKLKPASAFHRNRTTADGLHWVCASCNTLPVAERAQIELRRRFGMYDVDRDTLQGMWDAQGGCCAICRAPFEDTPHIDHDHGSGAVRGLLCMRCNTALGLLKDDPARCRAAASYLEDPPFVLGADHDGSL